MIFINPFELLEIDAKNPVLIDSLVLKKAKRRLFAEIDLSENGFLLYKNIEITKSSCEKAIDELEDPDKKEYYAYLTSNKPLNNFLINGELDLFANYKQDGIFKIKEFIEFISPYFTIRFEKSINDAFKSNDLLLFKSILRTQNLIDKNDYNNSFRSLTHEIQNRIVEIDEMTKKFKNGDLKYSSPDDLEIIKKVELLFPVQILNVLPPFFQSQINKIATSLNYLGKEIWESSFIPNVPKLLMEFLFQIDFDSLSKPIYQENYKVYVDSFERKQKVIINNNLYPELETTIVKLKEIESKIEKRQISNRAAGKAALKTDVAFLNSLPDSVESSRDQIASLLREISVSIWNKFKVIETSLKVINLALTIKVSESKKKNLLLDFEKLLQFEKEIEINGDSNFTVPELSTTNGIGTTIYGQTLYFVFFGIPILPISRWNCESLYGNSWRFYGKYKLHTWQKVWKLGLPTFLIGWFVLSNYNFTSNSENSDNIVNNSSVNNTVDTAATVTNNYTNTETVSLYEGNQLKNGSSPFNNIFGKGRYGSQSWILFTNNFYTYDVIICLVNYATGEVIRNEYVRANTSYKMINIPEGTYYFKAYYGTNWNPEKFNFGGGLGAFDNYEVYEVRNDVSELLEIETNEKGHTTWDIKLKSSDSNDSPLSNSNESFYFNK
jgi:hypothetical protein